ncbi:MAG TPA: amidohydrolase family protein [Solirubrobacteraceae bacterium]|nr:amidohydrolase family protein [Solirubrobacteraceae bacterium]
MDIAPLIEPWAQLMREQVPGLELFDAHTHLGQNDPDGMSQTPEQLHEVLASAGARGAFVFPMHEPEGYPPANDMVIDAAARSAGLLTPFCRVSPHSGDAPAEAERALAAGAKGIKLHPRAEQFTLDHPAVRDLAAIADERELPILIHAGRGIPALGAHVVALAGEFPGARFILAHAGVCDLSWIWRAAAEHPNLLFDTAWWMPADLQTLFALVPPGQVLFASDAPYGHTLMSAITQMRSALQVGLSVEQIRCIGAEQSLRIAAGEPLAPAGPPVGERERASHLLLDRVAEYVMLGAISTMRGGEGGPEMLALARMACDVPDSIDDAPVFEAIRSLLDTFEEMTIADPTNRRRLTFLILAASVARTPDVPVPAIEEYSAPRSAAAR